jgi:hypothetical protein
MSTLSALAPLIGSLLGNARRVAIFSPYSLGKSLSRFLHTPADFLGSGGDELLPAVDVVSCTRKGSVGHDVYG